MKALKKDSIMVHSTPYADKARPRFETSGSDKKNKVNREVAAAEIREDIPAFVDDTEKFPELTFRIRKKIHIAGPFFKRDGSSLVY